MPDNEKDNKIIHDWWHHYRGRYSQRWVRNFGMIPNLPASYDNANDIYELLAWLQRGFKMILDDFANLELEFEQFKDGLINLITELIPQLMREFIYSKEFHDRIWVLFLEFIESKEFHDKVTEIIREFIETEEFHSKVTEIIKEYVDSKFKEIWDKIKELEDLINSLLGDGYTELVEGRDYEYELSNDFYIYVDNLKVSVIDSQSRVIVNVATEWLGNEDLTPVKQNHNSPVSTIPASIIASIRFLGDYAYLNNRTSSMGDYRNKGGGTWNITPKEARASFRAEYNMDLDYNGWPFVISLRSYQDGYNNQFSEDYTQSLRLRPGIVDYDFTILKG